MNSVESLDIFAIVWFAVCYIGYTLFTNYGPFSNNSLMSKMHLVRLAWMHQMVDRDNRMVDVNILDKNLQRKSFFCINCGQRHRWADPLPVFGTGAI